MVAFEILTFIETQVKQMLVNGIWIANFITVVEKCLYAKIVAMYSSLLVIIGAETWYLEEEVKH